MTGLYFLNNLAPYLLMLNRTFTMKKIKIKLTKDQLKKLTKHELIKIITANYGDTPPPPTDPLPPDPTHPRR